MEITQRDTSLYNPDLAPISWEKRSWGTYNYASLWVAMSVCIPTYMLASGLIAGGMSWIQAVLTILLGNLIVSDSHAAERPCRHALRHSVSCLRSRIIWSTWSKCPGCFAGSCGVRLVWHPGMDWRASHLLDAAHCVARWRKCVGEQLDLLLSLLGAQSVCYLAWH